MYNFHPYSGGGKIILALLLEMGRIDPSNELRDIVYKCTECGNCAVSCKFLNTLEPLEIMMKLREKLVEAGIGPMPKQKEYIEAIKKVNNPYNEPHETRMKWLPEDIKIDPDAKLLYYIGCTSSYRRKEMAISTVRIMKAAGISFNILQDDEFRLLAFLAANPGRIYSRGQLMERIYSDERIVSERTIDSHIKRLRKKLRKGDPDFSSIETLYGIGYRFIED